MFILTLQSTAYVIDRAGGGSGRGRIAVNDNEITFSHGSLGCEDEGTWTWAIADGVLTFTPTGTRDPCSGRIDALENRSYALTGAG